MKYKLLIIGSSDLESIDGNNKDDYLINLEKDVLESRIINHKYIPGINRKCKKCKLTHYEHKIGYQIIPTNPKTVEYINPDGSSVNMKSHFSDFWKEKYEIFSKIKTIHNKNFKNLEIIYDTLDPLYKKNKKYISKINKINTNIASNLGLKSIDIGRKHLYNNYLDKSNIKHTYDMIIVISAGPGWLITPKNINIIYKLLNNNGLLCHMHTKNIFKNKFEEKSNKMEFNSFLSMCIPPYKKELSNDDKKCIQNYNKMLLSNKFSYIDNGILMKRL
jgi:hypothetical protein